MSSELRRQEIIDATVPLLEEEGFTVSTKRIAEAAGIAEGTIFRVFPTKEDLIHAAISSVMDVRDLVGDIQNINPATPLPDKIAQIFHIVEQSASRIHTFMAAMAGRSHRKPPHGFSGKFTPPKQGHPHQRFSAQTGVIRTAIEQTLTYNTHELTVSPDTAAAHVLTVALASVMTDTVIDPVDSQTTVTLVVRALTGKEPE